MNAIKKQCPKCSKAVLLPYKRRARPGFCSLSCAYAHRTIYPTKKTCRQCGQEFARKGDRKYCSYTCSGLAYKGRRHSSEARAKMSSFWSDGRKDALRLANHLRSRPKKLLASDPTKLPDPVVKTCRQCLTPFTVRGYGKGLKRLYCSERCYYDHLGTDNHMKSDDMRRRLSEVAKSRTTEAKRKIGASVSKAWQDGKFDGVRTGKCHWYDYAASGGARYKVQGAWELAFVHWMDRNDMAFKAHRKWIGYVDSDGIKRTWYPDFYVEAWDEWVDVKADHFYKPDKFACIRASNPSIKVRVLLADDLKRLGVQIYGKGGRYLPYLQELVDRYRVQSKAKIDRECK